MTGKTASLLESLAKLKRVLIPDRRDIASVYMFAILAGMVQLSLPLGIQSIISFVMADTISTSILVLIVMVVFGVFISGFLQIRQMQIIEKVKQKLFVRFSFEYSDRLPKLDIEKLDKEYLPELVNRYFDNTSLQKVLDKLLLDLPAAIIQVILGILLLAFYHPIFIAFGLVLIVFVLTILRLTSPPGLQSALKASTYKYKVAGWLQEIARTIKTFKYTRGTSPHMRKSDELVGAYLDSRTNHFKILLTQYWSLVAFKIIITAAMLGIGSYLLVNQLINVGQFIAADIVIIAIIGSIEKLITNLDSVYDALVSVEKLSVITDAETEKSGTIKLKEVSEGVSIRFKNVSFSYGDNPPVLNNISFEIPAGKMVHIKGESGSGKSTMLRLLTGAFKNNTGSVLLDEIPVANYQVESLRQHTGILLGSQDIFLGSLWDNITLGNDNCNLRQVSELAKLSGLDKFVESCKEGYDTLLQPLGTKLAGTVRKNILLLRALLGEYRLLLLEEPFQHLDEPYKTNMIDYIKNYKGATSLIASYDNSLDTHCDMVIKINREGRLVI
jgi:ABC-type bacteriocin/lantibiotic exporter with double-glycine peptidase domain